MFGRTPNQYANTPEFSVAPTQPVTPSKRQKVRLFFIGVNLLRDDNKDTPFFVVNGRPYKMPPIGEYIEVDELVAKEIEQRSLWPERGNPVPVPGVTTDPVVAKAVKDAFENGTYAGLDIRTMTQKQALKELDDAALLAELQRRGIAPAAPAEPQNVQPPSDTSADNPPSTPSPRSKK